MSPELSIIIVNWNGEGFLPKCLESIERHPPGVDYDIIVVDNASTDNSVDWLRSASVESRFPDGRLRVIENSENVGFGRANNKAFAASEAKYFFLLNPDAELKAGSIDNLLAVAETDARIGMVSPRIIDENGHIEPNVWRNPPTAWETLLTGFRLYKILPRSLRAELLLGQFWTYDRQRDITFVHGAALLLRRDVVAQVGGFDEDFFMYGEDQEFSLRAYRAGWRLIFTPNAEVIHSGSRSSKLRWSDADRLRTHLNGYVKFYEKSLSRWQIVRLCSANLISLGFEKFLRVVRRQPDREINVQIEVHAKCLRSALTRMATPVRTLTSKR